MFQKWMTFIILRHSDQERQRAHYISTEKWDKAHIHVKKQSAMNILWSQIENVNKGTKFSTFSL
jgi:hypothetical protein